MNTHSILHDTDSSDARLIPLGHIGIVRITGDDAAPFLQRQFTNDMSEVTVDKASQSAYLTAKGRIIANFLIVQTTDGYLLAMSAELTEALARRLKLFVMRDKVNISCDTGMQCVGAVGANISQHIDVELPNDDYQVAATGDILCIRIPGSRLRFAIIGPTDRIVQFQNSLETSNPEVWKFWGIEAGIPLITSATTEALIPQAVNLDLIGAVSFTKGCYPGQEIVARLHYRGGVNRRMIRAIAPTGSNAEAGTSVRCKSLLGDLTGTIVNSVSPATGQPIQLLLSVPLKFLRHSPLELDNSTEIEVLPENLPYSVPEFA